jgi:hypothetical protein
MKYKNQMAKKKLPEPYDVLFIRKKIHQMESFISEQMKLSKEERLTDRVKQYRQDCTTYRKWIHERMELEPVVIIERDKIRMDYLLAEAQYDIMMKEKGFEKLMVSPGVYAYVDIKEAIDRLGSMSFGGIQVEVEKRNTFSYQDIMDAIRELPQSRCIVVPRDLGKYDMFRGHKGFRNMQKTMETVEQVIKNEKPTPAEMLKGLVDTSKNIMAMMKRVANEAAARIQQLQYMIEKFAQTHPEILFEAGLASWSTDPGDEMDPIIQYNL